jgi:hypothetical protein
VILRIVDKVLPALPPEFEDRYAKIGRRSISPKRLLRAANPLEG